MTRAVVFAYHNVGVRCLATLLAHPVEVPLVVTHRDNPQEKIWFDSVARFASERDIPVLLPEDPNTADIAARVAAGRPDFLFSFYYRRMLAPALLQLAPRGAYNMHGSLLPLYRGRAPVNWAVIRGERETGATLHTMVAKPDAGAIIAQQRVPILPDDTALDVFSKVTVAAELALDGVLPGLLAGSAVHIDQDLARGSYFGARTPEDGRIDWNRAAEAIHNLVRGVAPPYPGAFCDLPGGRLRVLRTLLAGEAVGSYARPHLFAQEGRIFAQCGDRRLLRILEAAGEGAPDPACDLPAMLAGAPLPLTDLETSP